VSRMTTPEKLAETIIEADEPLRLRQENAILLGAIDGIEATIKMARDLIEKNTRRR
jgi:sugar-specific transcriptional regulator TrmB